MNADTRPLQIAVCGAGTCGDALSQAAFELGRALARAGAVVLTGGRGGVMVAASAGARAVQGTTVGILPGAGPRESPPNPCVDVALFTGLGQARNQVLVLSADAVVAVGGGWGTLSEIALALKQGRPVVVLDSWSLERPDGEAEPLLTRETIPEEAARAALEAAGRSRAAGEP